VVMKAVTWTRDSHGLFDYESRHVSKKTMKSIIGGKILRIGNDTEIVESDRELPDPSGKVLAVLNQYDGFYTVSASDHEKLWLVVRSLRHYSGNTGYQLSQGDVLKLGRMKFKVKYLKTGTNETAEKSGDLNQSQESDTRSTEGSEKSGSDMEVDTKKPTKALSAEELAQLSKNGICRICYSEQLEKDNPLISPCKCDGSLKFIHLKCLQTWLVSKANVKQNDLCLSYYWKSLECELCKTQLPSKFDCGSKTVDCIELKKPETNYMVLEAVSNEKNKSKSIHLIQMQDLGFIKLGRGHDSDVRISDISVSRCHALIKFANNKFYLEDNVSKFGTLIQVKRPVLLEPHFSLAFQMGRTVISFSMKPTSSSNHHDPATLSEDYKLKNLIELLSNQNSGSEEMKNFLAEYQESHERIPGGSNSNGEPEYRYEELMDHINRIVMNGSSLGRDANSQEDLQKVNERFEGVDPQDANLQEFGEEPDLEREF